MRSLALSLSLLVGVAVLVPVQAAVYKCTGASGRIRFSDRPCAVVERSATIEVRPASGTGNGGGQGATRSTSASVPNDADSIVQARSESASPKRSGGSTDPARAAGGRHSTPEGESSSEGTRSDADKMPALHRAIREGKLQRVTELLDAGASTEQFDSMGNRPLYIASVMNQVAIGALLLERGAAVDGRSGGRREMTALHDAAFHGRREFAVLLLDHDAKLELRNSSRQTPLILALTGSKGEAVALLLIERGVDIRAVDRSGNTPLHLAAASQHERALETLLDRGADVNALDVFGNTPLMDAVHMADDSKRAPAVVEMLLARGANRAVTNQTGHTAAEIATDKGWTEVVAMLR